MPNEPTQADMDAALNLGTIKFRDTDTAIAVAKALHDARLEGMERAAVMVENAPWAVTKKMLAAAIRKEKDDG